MKQNLQSPYELFGVECGEGWNDLLKPLFEYIENYNKDKSEEEKIVIEQVKEKFGTLRFYCNFCTDELNKLIEEAEEKSSKTCELCGSTEDIGYTTGWITTMCRKCAKKSGENSKNRIFWIQEGKKFSFDSNGNEELITVLK